MLHDDAKMTDQCQNFRGIHHITDVVSYVDPFLNQ